MVRGHKIKEVVGIETFMDIIKNIDKEDILITKHSLFRLHDAEKKIFEKEIKEIIKNNAPILVGIQYNKCYAVFYDYQKEKALKVVFNISINRCELVTFYIIKKNKIPVLK